MEARMCVRTIIVAVVAAFLLPAFSFAQTNVGDTVTKTVEGVVKKQFEKETGLDKVKDIKGITPGKIADKTVKYVQGDIPSQTMANLIQQLKGENGEGLPSSFKLYVNKTQNRNAPYFTENACERAANQRLMEGLFNAEVKAHFSPWVDIAWTAVKSISDGGKTIGQLIAENTKSKVEGLIKEALFGKAEPKVEVVTIPHHDSCGTTTKITWDPINMRVIVVTSGDCQCKRYTSKLDNESANLKEFTVTLVAPVTVENVRIEEKNKFIFWKSYSIQAQYKVGKLAVVTEADCNCSIDEPPPPEDKGFITGIFEWFSGLFDPPPEPEDKADPPEEEVEDTSESEDGGEGDTDESENTTGTGFWGGLFGGRDKAEEPEDQTEPEETQQEDKDEQKEEKPLQCGAQVSVDGRSSVATFPYRPDANGGVNFSCNSSCGPDQVCKVLPKSVGAFRDSCVYCADKPKDKKEDPPPPPKTEGNCEQAVRLLLDEYAGWFDPPITFSANGGVMSHEHRCFPEEDYDTHTRQPIINGVADAKIKAMCPTLKHVSSVMTRLTAGTKGLCRSDTTFSY